MQQSVLLIEDDEILAESLTTRLALEGMAPKHVATCAGAIEILGQQNFDLVVSDIRLPDGSGEDIYREMLAKGFLAPTVFVTAFGEIEQAVRLVQAGARDYVTKPYDIRKFIEQLKGYFDPLPAAGESRFLNPISPTMRSALDAASKLAAAGMPLLLVGPLGVGKRTAAEHIHRLRSSNDDFVSIGAATILSPAFDSTLFGSMVDPQGEQPGLLDLAGTIHIADLDQVPLQTQVKLAGLIGDRTFRRVGGTRIVRFCGLVTMGLREDPQQLIRLGRLSPELYQHVSSGEVSLPTLAVRMEDIEPLAWHFLEQAIHQMGSDNLVFDRDVLRAISNHQWPGNVRELRNRILRASVLSEKTSLSVEDVFPETRLDASYLTKTLDSARRDAERTRIENTLSVHGGRIVEAARALGVSRVTLWSKMKQLGINR